jgi:hypothetical protein
LAIGEVRSHEGEDSEFNFGKVWFYVEYESKDLNQELRRDIALK